MQVYPGRLTTRRAPHGLQSLDLGFLGGTLDSRLTFTRASAATYFNSSGVLSSATSGTPRFDFNPVTGAPNGLFVEALAATNQFVPSTNWVANSTVSTTVTGHTQNAAVAPDGTTTAELFIPFTTSGNQQVYTVPSLTVSSGYAFSVYMKAAGYNYAYLSLTNTGWTAVQTASFNLSSGTIAAQSANGTAAIQAVGNGWYRCSVTGTTAASGATVLDVIPSVTGADAGVFAGNGTSGILVWGAQAEIGAQPSSYIPTTTVSVTRAAEALTIPVGSWFVQSQGSLAVEWALLQRGSLYGAPVALVGSNTATDYIDVDEMTGATPSYSVDTVSVAGVSTAATFTAASIPYGTPVKGAVSWSVGGYTQGAHNGISAAQSAAVLASTPAMTSLNVGAAMHYQTASSLYIRRVRYWPRQQGATELASNTL